MEPYHYLFIDNASRLLDFQGKTVLEVGCGSGEMLKEMARRLSPRLIAGIDSNLGMWSASPATADNWEIAELDATNTGYPDNFFDIVISVGVFEHVIDLKGALREAGRVLKPSGKLYTEFSPIWSSVIGHHYNFWVEKDAGLIPGWGHLWMSEAQMLEYLAPRIGEGRAGRACLDIYRGGGINRLSRMDYYHIFLNSGLWVRNLSEHISLSSRVHFGGGESELTPEIFSRLRDRYGLHELGVLGFTLLLEKLPGLWR